MSQGSMSTTSDNATGLMQLPGARPDDAGDTYRSR